MKAADLCAGLFALFVVDSPAIAANVELATTGNLAVTAGSTAANVSLSTSHEDLGVGPEATITGFPQAKVIGDTRQAGEAVGMQIHGDPTSRRDEPDLATPKLSGPAGWALALAASGLVGVGLRSLSRDRGRRTSRSAGTVF